ncbi:MAG: radical SAM protein [Methanobacteriota archaeon]
MSNKLRNGSLVSGELPKGCALCARGSKLVLLVTGLCPASCYYCPLSDAKSDRDVAFADEMPVRRWSDILREAEAIGAEGAGITGGDPLVVMRRTSRYVSALKRKFGQDFHIHLYTADTDAGKVRALVRAGLDEIRFHPPVGAWNKFGRSGYPAAIKTAAKDGAVVGVEVPAIPGSPLAELLEALESTEIDFANLNELEFSETNWRELKAHGFAVKDDVHSGVLGSEESAAGLVRKWKGPFALHYCSASFKDGVQLRNRLLRRAERTARPSDLQTGEGTLLKGVVETRTPSKTRTTLARRFQIPPELIRVDRHKRTVEVAPWILEEIAGELDLPCYIVEEYPTADRLEVERRPLNKAKPGRRRNPRRRELD